MPETAAPAVQSQPDGPLPLFWPVALVAGTEKAKADLALRNLEFVEEEIKLHGGLKAKVASPNVVRLDLRTMVLRDYGRPGGIPTLVNAPFAGHRAMIADYRMDQSLVGTLLAGGVGHVALTDWKSATDDMKDFEIDNYLEELVVAIDDLGGQVGLCQGGWSSAMVAARFPDKMNALVLAGSPIAGLLLEKRP
jgi:poly(3-hydroxyalkanoate) synthetase